MQSQSALEQHKLLIQVVKLELEDQILYFQQLLLQEVVLEILLLVVQIVELDKQVDLEVVVLIAVLEEQVILLLLILPKVMLVEMVHHKLVLEVVGQLLLEAMLVETLVVMEVQEHQMQF